MRLLGILDDHEPAHRVRRFRPTSAGGFAAGLLTAAFVLGGCSGDGSTNTATNTATNAATNTTTNTPAADCTNLGTVRGPSEPCCPTFGLDACGASLVCAALEGRTVPTCTLEGTQNSLEECTVDALCISGDCAEAVGLCASLVGESCQADVGCADPTGAFDYVICTGEPTITGISPNNLTCESATDADIGGPCGLCETTNNCISAGVGFQCILGRCMGTTGVAVTADAGNCCAQGSTASGTGRICK